MAQVMTLTEIRDILNQKIDAGHGDSLLRDDDNPEYAISGILTRQFKNASGDTEVRFYIDFDEVKS